MLKHMQGIPEQGNPPPVIRLYVDLNLQTLVSADIVPQTNAEQKPSAPGPPVVNVLCDGARVGSQHLVACMR